MFHQIPGYLISNGEAEGSRPALLHLLIATSKAVDFLEGRTKRHGLKVALLAGTLAKMMGLTQREQTAILYAALLHDVGLSQVASVLLPHLPPGLSLTRLFHQHALINARVVGNPHENGLPSAAQKLMGKHPQFARVFVKGAHLSQDVLDLIASHHELCDGSGYPYGLTRHEIPIGGRILAFADVVEAVMEESTGLVSKRQTLENFLDFKALHKFDPDIIEAFRDPLQQDDFLRQFFTSGLEEGVLALGNHRLKPLEAQELLEVCQAMGQLPDSLMPQHTAHHSEKVARLALKMAERLEVAPAQQGELVLAGLLHDIGMLGIPLDLLHQAGRLSREEWQGVHQHPHFSQEILRGIPQFENIITWVGEHHERMNGSGYPQRLKNNEISLGSRLIALADVFESITSGRPYREEAFEALDALPIMAQGRYRLYDSQLLNVLRDIVLASPLEGRMALRG